MVYLTNFQHYPQEFACCNKLAAVFINKHDRFLKCGRSSQSVVKLFHLNSFQFIRVDDSTFHYFFAIDINL